MSKSPEILFEQVDRCGVITLNRPQALNAVTYPMFAALRRHYLEWARDPHIYGVVLQARGKAFCAGGDIRALYEMRRKGEMAKILDLYGSEYQHNWLLERFSKPQIALINGMVMGGGVGISLYGTHRVAGEDYAFAMPEARIGFFPDIGGSWFLSRLPGKMGTYLALTGRTIGRADAYYLGLATHCIDSRHFDAIRAAHAQAEPVDRVLDGLHEDPGESELEAMQETIDRLFSAPSVEAIVAALDSESGTHRDWARAVAADLRANSPTSLKVAFRQMQIGPDLGLREALQYDFRIARRFLEGSEFYEGIRAAIIDKDRTPAWSPASLEEVRDAMIDAYFAPLEDGDLALENPFTSAPKS